MLPFIYPTCHQYIGDIMGIHHFSTRILVAVHVDFGSIGFLPNDVLQDCFGTQIIIIIIVIIIIYLMFEFNEGSPYGNQQGKVSILKWSNFGWFGSTAILGNIHVPTNDDIIRHFMSLWYEVWDSASSPHYGSNMKPWRLYIKTRITPKLNKEAITPSFFGFHRALHHNLRHLYPLVNKHGNGKLFVYRWFDCPVDKLSF